MPYSSVVGLPNRHNPLPKDPVLTKPAQIELVAPPQSIGDELAPGTTLCGGQYVIEHYLNSGGFGITYLARDSLGRKVVIKECFPGAICYRVNHTVRLRSHGGGQEFAKIIELFEKEARALAELEHPYIVGVHQIFHDNDTAYMALDYVEGRDLLQVIEEEPGRLSPEEIRKLLMKVLEAVSYLHERDILHRDISPDNILLEPDNSPVLIDFGAARESATRVSRVLSKVLTVKDGYSPQEFYLSGSTQGNSSDLYALAATFYHVVSGSPPPSSQLRLAAAAKNLKDPLEPLGAGIRGYERFFLDAINRCLSIFPAERLSSAREWLDLIDVERRRRVLREQAARDRDLERRIAEIVKQSRRDMAIAPPSETAKATPAPRTVPKPSPATAAHARPNGLPSAATDAASPADRTDAPPAADDARDALWSEEDWVMATPDTPAPTDDPPEADAAPDTPPSASGRLSRLVSGTVHLFQGLPSRRPGWMKETRR
jgi:non-specific serine/threonine protein kinase